jgi:TonB family protein
VAVISAQEEAVFKVGGGISQPRLVSKTEPEYSEEARLLGANSTVILSLVVSKDGSTRDIKLARRSGFGLDQKAMDAVAHGRFQPGKKGDIRVNIYATVEVNFRLLDRVDPIQTNPLNTAMPNARITIRRRGRRQLRLAAGCRDTSHPLASSFHLTFDVNQNGDVENLICAESAPIRCSTKSARSASSPRSWEASHSFHRKVRTVLLEKPAL